MNTEIKVGDIIEIEWNYIEIKGKPCFQLETHKKKTYSLNKPFPNKKYNSKIKVKMKVENTRRKEFIEASFPNSDIIASIPIMGLTSLSTKKEDLEQLLKDDPMNSLRDPTQYDTIEIEIIEKNIPNTYRIFNRYDSRYITRTSSIALIFSNRKDINNILTEKDKWSKVECRSKNLPKKIFYV